MLTFQPAHLPNRVLITGGMGFIGSHLAEALLEEGHEVTVIDDLSTGRFENIQHLVSHPNFHFAIDTITNEAVLDRLTSRCQMVFHLAAAVGVKLIVERPVHTVEAIVMGTEMVLKTALRYRAKVLITSTSEVYGKSPTIPFREDDDVVLGATTRSRWAYAASKMVDEFLALAYYHEKGLPVVICRLFNTVGPRQTGQYGMVIPRFVQQALLGQPLTIYGDGRQTRCFMHVHDAVDALIALASCPQATGQVFNAGNTSETTILDLAQRVLDLVDAWEVNGAVPDRPAFGGNHSGAAHGRLRFIPYSEAYPSGFEDMLRRVPSIAKIHASTGWRPRLTLDDVLHDVIAEFASERQAVALAA